MTKFVFAWVIGYASFGAAALPVKFCLPVFREEFLILTAVTAKDKGFFAKHGLDVQLVARNHQSSMPVPKEDNTRLVSDLNVAKSVGGETSSCEFGTSVVERFFWLEEPFKMRTQPLLVSSYGQDYDAHLVVSKDSTVKTVKDLRGQRIRVGQAPVRIALEKILAENGMTLNDVKLDYVTRSTEVLAKLDSGELGAAITYVPTMPYMMATGRVRILKSNIVKSYVQGRVPHSMVIGRRDFVAAQPEITRKLISALREATEYLRRNPSETIYALERNATLLGQPKWQIDRVTAEKAGEFVGKINLVDLYSGSAKEKRAQADEIRSYSQLLKKYGLIPEPMDLARWLGVSDNKVTSL